MQGDRRLDRVWGFAPLEVVHSGLALAVSRGGGLGFLQVGDDLDEVRAAIQRCGQRLGGAFGIRVPNPGDVDPASLGIPSGAAVDTAVIAFRSGHVAEDVSKWGQISSRVVVEVGSLQQARSASSIADVSGLVASGSESGGAIGDTGAFILLQQIVAETTLPVWVRGGIARGTAAAAIAAGATGVVLDAQLSLVREAESIFNAAVRHAVRAMDGSETRVLGGHRVYLRPDVLAARLDDSIDESEVLALLGHEDLQAQLLPIGQDGSLASSLADKFKTAGGVVQGIQKSIDEHLRKAGQLRPLAPGSQLASELKLTYPIAQGPMTRVSDRAAFAKYVADAGGLPFIALALMGGEEVRALLEETSALLGDLPWGVGILGFVPPQIRDVQLEAVHQVRPPIALIAGGRPSQASPLEAAGITTFLHVPSPGLLSRFLKDGARRFVFEGRECGGHVGPRSSFVLWEQQVNGLLTYADAGGTDGKGSLAGVDAFFAGGIHDERSAAAVSALAAPLAERGAGIGVLMGTAYLFTEESVAGGAILPGFQQMAVDCSQTTLLETSPGHATRCVDSNYVRAFTAAKKRLVDDGVPSQQMWAELEQLNLGRLRIASKGLTHGEGGLVTVDEQTQLSEGMFMIGDVATMRHQRTTVRDLHEQVSAGSTEYLTSKVAELGLDTPVIVREQARPVDIAVIGMASVFPGSSTTDQYWSNIVSGVDSITEVSTERWNPDIYFDPEHKLENAGRLTPSKWGGFLPRVPFDALSFGIPPASLAAIEPAQLLALETASRALADAGYADREFDRERVSVVFGAEAGADLGAAYMFRTLVSTFTGKIPPELEEFLPHLTEDSFPGLLANVISGRITNRLNLGGLNCTVDAACASSLASIDVAVKDLVTGSSDMVLCGGADLHSSVQDYMFFASVHALSPTGRSKAFDANADGIALGEGVACVVLKRLEDAQRDGDRVYSVIKSIAGSSDGRHLGLTAPRREGQRLALDRAYERAGISPAEVGLVEAHGTGTVVGDRTELGALSEMFAENGTELGSCTVGSVKSNIGHTKCAAGVASLIKASQALYRGVRPPTLHVSHPNSAYDPETSPFRFEETAKPWVDEHRVAGVSGFGFGGSNFHLVLTSSDDELPAHGLDQWKSEIFIFRGATRADATKRIESLIAYLDKATEIGSNIRLRDVASSISTGGAAAAQVSIVATDLADLRAKLATALEAPAGNGGSSGVFVARHEDKAERLAAREGQVAFCFPGQGSQRVGMLSDLFVAFPSLRTHLRAGEKWVDVMFPPAAFNAEDKAAQKAAITDTRAAQSTMGIGDLAVSDLLSKLGVKPAMTAGHSYGELVALATAGSISEHDLITLSEERASAILGAAGDDPGTMAAVAAHPDKVEEALKSAGITDVIVANRNSPNQAVISGPTEAVARAIKSLDVAGLRSKQIAVSCAFHSSVVAGASQTLGPILSEIEISEPSIPVWSNTLAAPYPTDAAGIRELLARQVAEPVRWLDQIEAMYAAGARVFVEAGAGRVLTPLIGKILGDRPHVAIATDVSGENGVDRFLRAIAELSVNGVELDTAIFFEGRATALDLNAAPPAPPMWIVDGALTRTRDGKPLPGGLKPLTEAPQMVMASEEQIAATTAAAAQAAAEKAVADLPSVAVQPVAQQVVVPEIVHSPETEDALRQYLASMREMVSAQREVMLRFLGGPGAVGFGEPAPASSSQVLDVPAQRAPAAPAVSPAPAPASTAPASTSSNAVAAELLDKKTTSATSTSGVTAASTPVAPAPVAATGAAGSDVARVDAGELLTAVVGIVAERTGYPTDMLDPDQDLEADLSIDSIKRIEILSELADRVGLPGTGDDDVDDSVIEELAQVKTMRGIVDWIMEAQAQILGEAATVAAPAPVQDAATSAVAAPAPPSAPIAHVAPVAEPAVALIDAGELLTAVVGIVAERTGYPTDMLDPDQDLEADLSIDSIKRIEILSELADRVGLPGAGEDDVDDSVIEELAQVKTMRGIVDWIMEAQAQILGEVGAAAENIVAEAAAASPPVTAAPVAAPGPAESVPEVVANAAPAVALIDAGELLTAVVGIVAERTGYPTDMLDPDQDLEADLSIDSIKRIEILSELADRVGLPGAGEDDVDDSVIEELAQVKTMRGIVDWIMEAQAQLLGEAAAAAPAPAAEQAQAAPATQVTEPAQASSPVRPDSPELHVELPVPEAAGPAVALIDAVELLASVVSIVAERTGYPTDMLDPDQDLEADLSIDSIKRIEILSELADRVGLPGAGDDDVDDSVIEELAQVKTMRGIVDWIMEAQAQILGEAAVQEVPASGEVAVAEAVAAPQGSGLVPSRSQRFAVKLEEIAQLSAVSAVELRGKRFAIVDDGRGVALHLGTLLEEREATAQLVSPSVPFSIEDGEHLDGFIDLSALGPDASTTALDSYPAIRQAAVTGLRWIVGVSAMGGKLGRSGSGTDGPEPKGGTDGSDVVLPSGVGLPGLFRTLAQEYPQAQVKAVDLDPKEEPSSLATVLLGEILASDGRVVVGHSGQKRYTTVPVAEEISAADVASLGLDSTSVVVLTGGARGITAKVARRIAATAHCRVALIGRTPLPTQIEDPAFADAHDAVSLRRVIVSGGVRDPHQVEATVRRVLAEREVLSTLAEVRENASELAYFSVDVRDDASLRGVLDQLQARYGKVDVVVHAAGILDDKLVKDKSPESFQSVFTTKVNGALSIARWLSERAQAGSSALLVLFGSVSGVFGNKGQADYAAANDTLDTLAAGLDGRNGLRVISVDWGPWGGGGMVSAELEREYEKRGVGLLDPDDAISRLMDEIARPQGAVAQVVVMRSTPAALEAIGR